MAPLIKAEILGTAGEVLATTLHEAPVVIGAATTANVRIRGEGVAEEHLHVSVAPSGAISLRQLDATRETFVGALSLTAAEVASPVVLTVGDVALRLSSAEEAAAPSSTEEAAAPSTTEVAAAPSTAVEPPAPRRARAWGLFAASLALAGVAGYVVDYTDSPGEETAYLVLGVGILILFWCGAWAVGNRLFGHPLAFARHLRVAALFTISGLALTAVEAVVLASVQVAGLSTFLNWTLWAPWTVAFLGAHMLVAGAWPLRRVLLVSGAIYLGVWAFATLIPSDRTPMEQVQASLDPIGYLPSGLYLGGSTSVVGEDAEALVQEVRSLPSPRTVVAPPGLLTELEAGGEP